MWACDTDGARYADAKDAALALLPAASPPLWPPPRSPALWVDATLDALEREWLAVIRAREPPPCALGAAEGDPDARDGACDDACDGPPECLAWWEPVHALAVPPPPPWRDVADVTRLPTRLPIRLPRPFADADAASSNGSTTAKSTSGPSARAALCLTWPSRPLTETCPVKRPPSSESIIVTAASRAPGSTAIAAVGGGRRAAAEPVCCAWVASAAAKSRSLHGHGWYCMQAIRSPLAVIAGGAGRVRLEGGVIAATSGIVAAGAIATTCCACARECVCRCTYVKEEGGCDVVDFEPRPRNMTAAAITNRTQLTVAHAGTVPNLSACEPQRRATPNTADSPPDVHARAHNPNPRRTPSSGAPGT